MFYALFGLTLAVAIATSVLTARFFDPAVNKILARILGRDLTDAWRKYIFFAIVVTGVSGGVRQWSLEKYLPPAAGKGSTALDLTGERWLLELFNTFIDTLRSIAWVMLLFFLCAMLAHVIMKAVEMRKGEHPPGE
ncbi:hypothetical protein VI26_19610 [Chromobacterium sp. LK1]|uniref:hypothetical protein n=1 Tax=Chromobacterium sp. LK1 TaxID=1628193 RepID=UPI000652A869|nr:hypothetical protein [Chromobacterium sp. LK1]KMN31078.1 hypothetical protein VI26_19610 [Chromobacterium sp. LK1]